MMASAFHITVMINTNVTVHPDTMGTTVKQVNYRTGMKKKILCFQHLPDSLRTTSVTLLISPLNVKQLFKESLKGWVDKQTCEQTFFNPNPFLPLFFFSSAWKYIF